jgi:DNA-binding NarL/FixJ family response regulator
MPTTYHIPLKKLKPIHMKIIELHLLCWKNKDIAKELGVSKTTVSHTLRDPILKNLIKLVLRDRMKK